VAWVILRCKTETVLQDDGLTNLDRYIELRAQEHRKFFDQQDESSDEDDLEVSNEEVLYPALTLLGCPSGVQIG
jgi:hypothetical protein